MSEYQPKSSESLSALNGEHLTSPEHPKTNHEQLDAQHQEQLKQVEQARSKLDRQPEPDTHHNEQAKVPNHHPSRIDKQLAYFDTLRSVQRHLTPINRQFSKFIHTPTIEKSSELAGATIARPSVVLGATTTAALLGSFLYITARIYGFSLSGSEFILSLVIGGVLGLLIEALSALFKRRK